MNNGIKLSVIVCALLAPVLASAATTADLKLIGTITPAACVPNFTGGSTIDYGNIAATSLGATAQTTLPDKTTKLTVTCDAPVKFAFAVLDERSASAVTTLTTVPGSNPQKFGLGTADDGSKIGAYSMIISNETAGSGVARRLESTDSGTTWTPFSGIIREGSIIGFGNSATATAPGAHTSIAVDLMVGAAIDKSSNLPITNEIKIDGLATFEVKYL